MGKGRPVHPQDDEWQAPIWAGYTKHHPVTDEAANWQEIIRSTSRTTRGKAIAKYGPYPEISANFIENAEMETIRIHQQREAHENTGELPRPKPHVRAFWRKMNRVIGASQGKETEFIYVEWHLSGIVHGRPMTESDLRRRGKKP